MVFLQRFKTRPGAPMPVIANSKLQEDLSYIHRLNSLKKPNEVLFSMSERRRESANHQESELTGKIKHAQVLQELLLVLAICNTVVVSKHPHHDVVSFQSIWYISTVPLIILLYFTRNITVLLPFR